jgi:hypothetical protein
LQLKPTLHATSNQSRAKICGKGTVAVAVLEWHHGFVVVVTVENQGGA